MSTLSPRFFLTAALFVLPCLAASAQNSASSVSPPAAQTTVRGATLTLLRALEPLNTRNAAAGIKIVADSTVAYERVAASLLDETTAPDEAAIEKELSKLVRVLPSGTVWAKLYLPAPAAGRAWKGDDVADFAFAQARLFGTVGVPASDGSIEILGKRVAKEASPPFVSGLNLKPVYLLTNTRRQMNRSNATPWSAANQEQWGKMSSAERKQYGQEQAKWILSLPPEQQAQMLEQIKQHDQFFDTVKDPLEKLIGHDL